MTIPNSPNPALAAQPRIELERDGIHYTLLGTAHVSRASVEAVEAALAEERYDIVAVELDPQRHRHLTDPGALHDLDLIRILREGKAALFAANLALAAYQRRLAEQLGVEPGAELKAAAQGAERRGLPLWLIDRDVGLTFRRALSQLGFWNRSKLGAGILASMFVDEKIEENEIEKLKEGDMLERSFGEFAAGSPALYRCLIDERDRYMAARLREEAAQRRDGHVLVVVGAGHLQGLATYLSGDDTDAVALRHELENIPQRSSVPWFTLFLVAFVLGGFAWGFWRGGADLGGELVLQWVLATGGLGALGCALAGGHPLSIVAAFVASPLTPLHPALASGTISALVETWVRRPTYADFLRLRDDAATVRGWWRNRVARVLLNFFLTSLGTAIGVWTGGLAMLRNLL